MDYEEVANYIRKQRNCNNNNNTTHSIYYYIRIAIYIRRKKIAYSIAFLINGIKVNLNNSLRLDAKSAYLLLFPSLLFNDFITQKLKCEINETYTFLNTF